MKLIVALLLCSGLYAQTPQTQYTLTASAPAPVPGGGGRVVGTQGQTPIYYWVIARYPAGTSVALGPILVNNTVGVPNLSTSNYVALSWTGVTGATGYDVLRNSTSQYPANPTCAACAVAVNTTATGINDQGTSTAAYPNGAPGPAPSATVTWSINNRDLDVPYVSVLTNYGGTAIASAWIQYVLSAPSGSCSNGAFPLRYVIGTSNVYACSAGTWQLISGSGGGGVNCGGTGILVQTAVSTYVCRTLTGSSSVTIVNGNGVSGNPTFTATPSSSDIGTAILVEDTGTVNAYAGCPTPAVTLTDGLLIQFRASAANTSSTPTLNLCGIGAKTIINLDGTALANSEIPITTALYPGGVLMSYNSTSALFVLLTPAQPPLAPITSVSRNKYPRSNGTTAVWERPMDPGDGRRAAFAFADGSATAPAPVGMSLQFVTTTGAPSAVAPAGSNAAAFRLTAGSGGSDYSGFDEGSNFIWRTARNLYFDTTVAFATSPTRIWIALSNSTAATLSATNTPATGTFGFRYVPGTDTTWTCAVSNGSSLTTASSGVSFDTNPHRYEVLVIDSAPSIQFFIDGTEVCTSTSTANMPSGTNLQASTVALGASQQVDFMYWYAEGDK